MKKILVIIGCILLVVITAGVAYFVLSYTGVLNKPEEIINTSVRYNVGDKYYTVRKYSWEPSNYNGMINYISNLGVVSTNQVVLHLEDDMYYPINIPSDISYEWDFGKTIFGSEGEFLIRVVNNCTIDTLSAMAGIDNGIALSPTCLLNNDNKKGVKKIAKIIEDTNYGLICEVYENEILYTVLRDYLVYSDDYIELYTPSYESDYTKLNSIAYSGDILPMLTVQELNLEHKEFLYEDSKLHLQVDAHNYKDVIDRYLLKLNMISLKPIESVFSIDGVLYAKAGNCYLGMFSYSSNMTVVLLGEGEEANCNIISVLKYLTK